MKFYIDFEAMQFSNYIISIGCVREDGATFKSLVKPANGDTKVSKFITDLTGITSDMVKSAPDADYVFEEFYNWIDRSLLRDELPEFYCYGNCDTTFIKANADKSQNRYAKMILNYMFLNIKDLAPKVQRHFGLVRLINLAKVASYYKGEEIIQDHDSLGDAELLKYVAEQVDIHSKEEDNNAFPEYKEEFVNTQNGEGISYKVIRIDKKGNKKEYSSLIKAAKALIKDVKALNKTSNVSSKNVAKKIKKVGIREEKIEYQGFFWELEIVKHEALD